MRRKIILSLVFIVLCTIVIVRAKVTNLFKPTSTTYITSEHGDEYWADTYIGRLSIRGSDIFPDEDRYRTLSHPTMVKISYDVQGDWSREQLNMRAGDNTLRLTSITVKDKWNYGRKTQVYYDYRAIPITPNNSIYGSIPLKDKK